MDKEQLVKRVRESWGEDNRLIMAIEEMAELQKALTKQLSHRGKLEDITEEIADVEFMLDQLKIVFNNSKEIEKVKNAKMERLEKKLDEWDKEK